MPVARVREVQFVGAGTAPRGAWLEAVPDGVTSDLVVVGKADGFEFVECAITAVSAETVTVILDEETIPVRRSKVVGLRWLPCSARLCCHAGCYVRRGLLWRQRWQGWQRPLLLPLLSKVPAATTTAACSQSRRHHW